MAVAVVAHLRTLPVCAHSGSSPAKAQVPDPLPLLLHMLLSGPFRINAGPLPAVQPAGSIDVRTVEECALKGDEECMLALAVRWLAQGSNTAGFLGKQH